jgi:hypothetical protein
MEQTTQHLMNIVLSSASHVECKMKKSIFWKK